MPKTEIIMINKGILFMVTLRPPEKNRPYQDFHHRHREGMIVWFNNLVTEGISEARRLNIVSNLKLEDAPLTRLIYAVLPGIITTCLPVSVGLLIALQIGSIETRNQVEITNQKLEFKQQQVEQLVKQVDAIADKLGRLETRLSVVEARK